MIDLSVLQEQGVEIERKWKNAGLHPLLMAVGCGTADFQFTEDEFPKALKIAGDAVLTDIDE